MPNKSIFDAFERLWQYIVSVISDKADADTVNVLVGDDVNKSVREIAGEIAGGVPIVMGSSTNGSVYTATVDDFTLEKGRTIVFIPSRVSASTSATLNINGTGAIRIYQSVSASTSTNVVPSSSGWMAANAPIVLVYNGTYWKTVGMRSGASDMYGTLALSKGGTGGTSASAARTNLSVYSKTEVDSLITGLEDIYSQPGHAHVITDVDGLEDRLVTLEDSVEALGSGSGGGSMTEPLVLTGNCYCSDEDIVSTTDTQLVFTVSLSGSTASDAYYTYYGMNGQTKRDIVIRLTNTYTPSALGTTDFEPIVYIEAPVYKAAIDSDSYYGVVATGTGYCADPKYYYTVSIEYFTGTAKVTIEKHSNDETGASGGGGFPTPEFVENDNGYFDEEGWYALAVTLPNQNSPHSLGTHYLGNFDSTMALTGYGCTRILYQGWVISIYPTYGTNIYESDGTGELYYTFSEVGMKFYCAKLS